MAVILLALGLTWAQEQGHDLGAPGPVIETRVVRMGTPHWLTFQRVVEAPAARQAEAGGYEHAEVDWAQLGWASGGAAVLAMFAYVTTMPIRRRVPALPRRERTAMYTLALGPAVLLGISSGLVSSPGGVLAWVVVLMAIAGVPIALAGAVVLAKSYWRGVVVTALAGAVILLTNSLAVTLLNEEAYGGTELGLVSVAMTWFALSPLVIVMVARAAHAARRRASGRAS